MTNPKKVNGEPIQKIIIVDGTTGDELNLTNNAIDVSVQDQYTPTVIVRFNKINVKTTLSVQNGLNDYTITVADPTGISIGNYLILFSDVINRYSVFTILDITGSVITLDSAIDAVYPIGANVDVGITNMNQNGSTTPVIFGVRGTEVGNEVQTTIDITRIIFECITTDAVDLAKFGDLDLLSRGLLLRKRDGTTRNIFNVKSNGEIAGIMLDWIPYSASNPAQGVNGFTARLTFSGQEKLGVVQRLEPGEDLEFWIQDDLTDLVKLNVTAEGHNVE